MAEEREGRGKEGDGRGGEGTEGGEGPVVDGASEGSHSTCSPLLLNYSLLNFLSFLYFCVYSLRGCLCRKVVGVSNGRVSGGRGAWAGWRGYCWRRERQSFSLR